MATFYSSHRPPPSVPRTDFGPAPPGYIPGIGRGAVGFTTRSDIGPARPMQEEQVVGRSRVLPIPPLPLGYGARQGIPTVAPPPSALTAASSTSSSSPSAPASSAVTVPSNPLVGATGESAVAEAKEEALDAVKYSDANYDEFGGYNEALFATGEYDAEDKEADAIYDAIDRRVDSRRKRRREEKEAEQGQERADAARRHLRPVLRPQAPAAAAQRGPVGGAAGEHGLLAPQRSAQAGQRARAVHTSARQHQRRRLRRHRRVLLVL